MNVSSFVLRTTPRKANGFVCWLKIKGMTFSTGKFVWVDVVVECFCDEIYLDLINKKCLPLVNQMWLKFGKNASDAIHDWNSEVEWFCESCLMLCHGHLENKLEWWCQFACFYPELFSLLNKSINVTEYRLTKPDIIRKNQNDRIYHITYTHSKK